MQPLLLLLILLQGAYGENRLDASSTLVVDTVKFLKPSDFDVLLNDINEIDLYLIGEMEGAQYLIWTHPEGGRGRAREGGGWLGMLWQVLISNL